MYHRELIVFCVILLPMVLFAQPQQTELSKEHLLSLKQSSHRNIEANNPKGYLYNLYALESSVTEASKGKTCALKDGLVLDIRKSYNHNSPTKEKWFDDYKKFENGEFVLIPGNNEKSESIKNEIGDFFVVLKFGSFWFYHTLEDVLQKEDKVIASKYGKSNFQKSIFLEDGQCYLTAFYEIRPIYQKDLDDKALLLSNNQDDAHHIVNPYQKEKNELTGVGYSILFKVMETPDASFEDLEKIGKIYVQQFSEKGDSKYFFGDFESKNEAKAFLARVKGLGYKSARVVEQ